MAEPLKNTLGAAPEPAAKRIRLPLDLVARRLPPPGTQNNPFATLPFPSAGDRIKADDFKTLSQSLKLISDVTTFSSSLFGVSLGQARIVIAAEQYQIERIMTVFGTEL